MEDQIKKATVIWKKSDDLSVPRLLNKTAVRKVMDIQMSDQVIDFLDLVVFCLARSIVKESKKRDLRRISVEHVQDILSTDDKLIFNIGSVVYQDAANIEQIENDIVNRVYKKIIMSAFGSDMKRNATKKEIDLSSVDFPEDLDGVENGE